MESFTISFYLDRIAANDVRKLVKTEFQCDEFEKIRLVVGFGVGCPF
jgi:hypothetical protein